MKSRDGSKHIVICCNIPDFREADNNQKAVFEGFKAKWALKENDTSLQNLHLIFLHRDDYPEMDKFAPLRDINGPTKITFVGHSQAGSHTLQSDNIYEDEKNNEEYIRYHFNVLFLGELLFKNVKDPNIIVNRDKFSNDIDNATDLKVVFAGCNSARDGVDIHGQLKKSISHTFLNFCLNGHPDKILLCTVTGTNHKMYPVGTYPGVYNFLKYLHGKHNAYFHKMYLVRNSFSFHKPGNNYKSTFIISSKTTKEEVKKTTIPIETLNVTQANHYFSMNNKKEDTKNLKRT